MKSHRSTALLLAALATLVLSACGSSEDGQTANASSAGPIAITDDTGKRIELEAPAERVVTAEWDHTENALALGVTPVGAGDTDQYRDWVAAGDPIPAETASIGTRSEPSLEKIAALQPDLIIVGRDAVVKSRSQPSASRRWSSSTATSSPRRTAAAPSGSGGAGRSTCERDPHASRSMSAPIPPATVPPAACAATSSPSRSSPA